MWNEKPHSTQINFECMRVTFESGFWNWIHTPEKTDITHLKHNIDVQCVENVMFDSMNISLLCVLTHRFYIISPAARAQLYTFQSVWKWPSFVNFNVEKSMEKMALMRELKKIVHDTWFQSASVQICVWLQFFRHTLFSLLIYIRVCVCVCARACKANNGKHSHQ